MNQRKVPDYTSISFRATTDFSEKVQASADAANLSKSAWITNAIQAYLDDNERKESGNLAITDLSKKMDSLNHVCSAILGIVTKQS